MRIAAGLWARARREHRPTAGDQAIDADDWRVATENVADLSRYVGDRARSWIAIAGERKPP